MIRPILLNGKNGLMTYNGNVCALPERIEVLEHITQGVTAVIDLDTGKPVEFNWRTMTRGDEITIWERQRPT